MSHLVIDTNTFSLSNISDILNRNRNNESFNILADIIASGQIRGMHYTHTNSLGEAQKAAWVDGYDIHDCFFLGRPNGF